MGQLRAFKDLIIDWEMTPEDAVAIYLEWGNNGYRGGYQYAVKGKEDHSHYFVVNTWDEKPKVTLLYRNSDGADELAVLPLPEKLADKFMKGVYNHKGIYPVNADVKQWLESELYN
jgi:hypothetical protein